MVTADSAAAIAAIGFPIEVRYEDDSIDTTDVARVVAAARLDRHDQRFEEFVASTIPGAVRRVRPGVAPEWTFPRYDLDATRLLVEKVTSSLAPGAQFGDHNVVHRMTATALDYQGGRGRVLPPALSAAGAAAQHGRDGSRPEHDDHPARQRGRAGAACRFGSAARRRLASCISRRRRRVARAGSAPFLTRVSGHEIAVPLALSFHGSGRAATARCSQTKLSRFGCGMRRPISLSGRPLASIPRRS